MILITFIFTYHLCMLLVFFLIKYQTDESPCCSGSLSTPWLIPPNCNFAAESTGLQPRFLAPGLPSSPVLSLTTTLTIKFCNECRLPGLKEFQLTTLSINFHQQPFWLDHNSGTINHLPGLQGLAEAEELIKTS